MGNVVSALLMYALQAAWLCQRLIDQDYRQNHGSRLKPVVDCKNISEPFEITTEWTSHKRHNQKPRKLEMTKSCLNDSEFPRKHGENRRRKYGHRSRATNPSARRLNSSHPYLEGSDAFTTTVEYVNRLGQNMALRRAFSDINISSSCSEFRYFDNNQNYLSRGNVDETTISMTDQDFLRLIFTKGALKAETGKKTPGVFVQQPAWELNTFQAFEDS